MKTIIEEYKSEIKKLIVDPKYIVPVIFVAILSYGFAITHYSIGVDDLSFDRYVSGTYILSAKRWGTWLLYNILNIKEFTPFWSEFVVSTFMVIIAIILSAFLKKQSKDKINIWGCVIFSSIFISNPIINHFFIYQSTNLAVVISNLLMIIALILIMENYFGDKKIKIYIISIIFITLALSMYESCAQTYLVLLFISIFIKLVNEEEKGIFKFFCISIGCLIFGILGYAITGKITLLILKQLGIRKPNFACAEIISIDKRILSMPKETRIIIWKKYLSALIFDIMNGIRNYYPVKVLFLTSIIVLIAESINLLKTKKDGRIINIELMMFSNFILVILQVKIMYRIEFSWILTTAFLILYLYKIVKNRKILKYITSILIIFLIIFQTKKLNQTFYKDYIRFEKEKNVAIEIATDITKNTNYENKPIVYVNTLKNITLDDNEEKSGIINWGKEAFHEGGIETTKFINYMGYNFLVTTNSKYKEMLNQYESLDDETKNKNIIELEDCIIVNLDKY